MTGNKIKSLYKRHLLLLFLFPLSIMRVLELVVCLIQSRLCLLAHLCCLLIVCRSFILFSFQLYPKNAALCEVLSDGNHDTWLSHFIFLYVLPCTACSSAFDVSHQYGFLGFSMRQQIFHLPVFLTFLSSAVFSFLALWGPCIWLFSFPWNTT